MTAAAAPATRNHWLVKSEPDVFSWQQQVANGVEPWTGVRSFQARNNLRAMRLGDRAFFYHSNIGRAVMGVVEVVREAYPDPTVAAGEAGDWSAVDVRAVGPLPRPVTLAEMKADPALRGLDLLRLPRLSVVPVAEAHWRRICELGGGGF
jgi:predicted RNA-binding protein with PUA-like domain